MRGLVRKIEQYKLGELIAKALYWVENNAGKYTFQDLIDVINEYRDFK